MISNEMDPLVVNSGAAALDVIARQSGTENSSASGSSSHIAAERPPCDMYSE